MNSCWPHAIRSTSTLPAACRPLHRFPCPSAFFLQGQGRPGLAVQWGNWGSGGMAVRNKGFIERMERMGLGIGEPSLPRLWAVTLMGCTTVTHG